MIAVQRWGGVWVLAFALLAGCTSTSEPPPLPEPPVEESAAPSAPSGATVGIVLPPRSGLDPAHLAVLERDVARVADGFGPTLRDVRTYVPDAPEFVSDLAVMLADRSTDLVCALGPDAAATVTPLADLYRAVDFCATPADPSGDDDPSVSRVGVRAEELGHLVGVAARRSAGAGPVGVVLGGDDITGATFREGLLAGLAGVAVIEAELEDGDTLSDGVAQVLADGATVVVIDGAAGASAAAARAAEQAVVVAPAAIGVGPDVADRLVLSWRVRWDQLLRSPIRRALGEIDRGGHVVGFANDAFELVPGAAASPTLLEALQTAVAEVVSGAQDPREPSTGAPVDPGSRFAEFDD